MALYSAGCFWKEPLPESRPLTRSPKRKPGHGLAQERHIIGNQQQPQGQHPDTKERQDGEDAPDDQKNANRNAGPARSRLAKSLEGPCDPSRQLVLKAPENPLKDSCSVISRLHLTRSRGRATCSKNEFKSNVPYSNGIIIGERMPWAPSHANASTMATAICDREIGPLGGGQCGRNFTQLLDPARLRTNSRPYSCRFALFGIARDPNGDLEHHPKASAIERSLEGALEFPKNGLLD